MFVFCAVVECPKLPKKHEYEYYCRNLIGEDDCIKPSLTEMKLEPADHDDLRDIHQHSPGPGVRKADKVVL